MGEENDLSKYMEDTKKHLQWDLFCFSFLQHILNSLKVTENHPKVTADKFLSQCILISYSKLLKITEAWKEKKITFTQNSLFLNSC
jgi:hypothetical protein